MFVGSIGRLVPGRLMRLMGGSFLLCPPQVSHTMLASKGAEPEHRRQHPKLLCHMASEVESVRAWPEDEVDVPPAAAAAIRGTSIMFPDNACTFAPMLAPPVFSLAFRATVPAFIAPAAAGPRGEVPRSARSALPAATETAMGCSAPLRDGDVFPS